MVTCTDGNPRAVLVTGASTGIGRKTTELLAAAGHFVYAGARKQSDLAELGKIRNVRALRLDVTRREEIAAAAEEIAGGELGLHGLVNNAGVATLGPVVGGNEREFDLIMAVNVRGAYDVTRAFAPLVVEQRGRIVMMGSISGVLADRNASAYSMSKHAIEALTDSLAQEMEPLGVGVSVIEPGNFRTAIVKSAAERIGPGLQLPDLSDCEEPEAVATAVMLALFDAVPKRRYLVVSRENDARRTLAKHIEQLVQMNEGHRYTFAPHALHEILDAALLQLHSAALAAAPASVDSSVAE